MKMVDLKNEKVVDYFEMMIDEFNCGNDNEYKVGSRVSFKFEECEKGDLDNYDEEDVELFFKVRNYLKEEGEVKMILGYNEIEYSFKVSKKDIVCSFIEN
jgi:hypothetical protein